MIKSGMRQGKAIARNREEKQGHSPETCRRRKGVGGRTSWAAGGRASGREDGEARGKTGLENAGDSQRRGRSRARVELLNVAEDQHGNCAEALLGLLCLRGISTSTMGAFYM